MFTYNILYIPTYDYFKNLYFMKLLTICLKNWVETLLSLCPNTSIIYYDRPSELRAKTDYHVLCLMSIQISSVSKILSVNNVIFIIIYLFIICLLSVSNVWVTEPKFSAKQSTYSPEKKVVIHRRGKSEVTEMDLTFIRIFITVNLIIIFETMPILINLNWIKNL